MYNIYSLTRALCRNIFSLAVPDAFYDDQMNLLNKYFSYVIGGHLLNALPTMVKVVQVIYDL